MIFAGVVLVVLLLALSGYLLATENTTRPYDWKRSGDFK
jgi:hypothetical protein